MARFIILFSVISLGLQISCGHADEPSTTRIPEVVYEKLDPVSFASQLSRMDTFTLLDVRTPSEFEVGHIKGAVNLNFFAPDFESSLQQLDPDIPVFIYSNEGKRSSKALQLLKQAGISTIFELEGGYEAIAL